MIPIRNEQPLRITPFVTMALLGLNLAVFIWQSILPRQAELIFAHQFGVVPAWLTGLAQFPRPDQWMPRPLTLVTYQFLHGGFFHLAFNMLYLWIFGGKMEEALGRFRYTAFYLIGGVLAALSHIAIGPSSNAPMIGASGAVAAVLGAYLAVYPKNRIIMLFWFIFFIKTIRVPAMVFLALWFLYQVINAGGPGVAWMAHIGGFVAGMLLVRYFMPRPLVVH